jgi:DNA-binding NarL/FixJ family response regulator
VSEAPTAIVCDDAPGFRALMSALLGEAGLRVVGDGATWAEAERLAPGCDAVVVDLWMPEIDVAALVRVRAAAPDATLAVVTALALDDAAARIADAGVDLLLAKSTPPTEVAGAIAAHCRGRAARC